MSALNRIALAAIDYCIAGERTKLARVILDKSYQDWRDSMGCYRMIERNSPEWDAMMLATKAQYRALVNAKARERRAKKKLLQAVEVA